ncbi:MAG: M28 family peptidase [Myxococcota bacterium]|nr:M28 family peptidase [Myxococcota bacterium]
MRSVIDELCSPACAGRRPGTPEGIAARAVVLRAFRDAGLDPYEQPVPACGGANVLAKIRGDGARGTGYVLVGAHYDHLGKSREGVYWGADDNAAAIGVLAEVARALASEHRGRGVIIAAFDGEEPPYFGTGAMGSRHFLQHNHDPIDFMVCMDLVGHRFGPAQVPDEVGASLFALGSERSTGTGALVASLKRAEPGVIVRPADAEIIPPLSDYEPFWRARIPFLFLSAGRSRVYHTIDDTPDKLAYPKLAATARWLTRFVREARTRDATTFADARADVVTLDEIDEVVASLATLSPDTATARAHIGQLRAACDRSGNLPGTERHQLSRLVGLLEARLA